MKVTSRDFRETFCSAGLSDRQLPRLLPWRARFGLAAMAFGGSTAYALSFWLAYANDQVAGLARSVGWAAGLSWSVFGLVLLFCTRCRPSVLYWADSCLLTMAAGIAVKALTVILNLANYAITRSAALTTTISLHVHVAILALANLVMATIFIWRACRLGLSLASAVCLWFLVLNGLFVLIYLWLGQGGGFAK